MNPNSKDQILVIEDEKQFMPPVDDLAFSFIYDGKPPESHSI